MNRYQCKIRRLEEQIEPLVCVFEKDAKGQVLLDYVFSKLNIMEKDYFSLRFMDGEKQRHWIDPTKNIVKQMKGGPPYNLVFRVKTYPANPQAIKEGITQYHLFLQLCRDLQHGRLLCNKEDLVILAAYIIQANVGDYDVSAIGDYVNRFKLVPKQSNRFEKAVENKHKCLGGMSVANAEKNFIKKAHTLLTYGVDPHPVRDIYGTLVYIGLTYKGISLLKGREELQHFTWKEVSRLSFDGRTFYISALVNERKVIHRFRSETSAASKHLWKCAVDHQSFFKFQRSKDVTTKTSGSLFRGTRFRFSGRTQHELLEQSANITREEPIFARSPPLVKPRRTKSFMDHLYSSDVHAYDGFSNISDSNHSTPRRYDNQLPSYQPVDHENIEDTTTAPCTEVCKLSDVPPCNLSDVPPCNLSDVPPCNSQEDNIVANNHSFVEHKSFKPNSMSDSNMEIMQNKPSIFVKLLPCCSVAIFSLTLVLIILFEIDCTNLSAVRDFRSLQCVRDFYSDYYTPLKQSITEFYSIIHENFVITIYDYSLSVLHKLRSVLFSTLTESSQDLRKNNK
ncbi:FERM domain-containing protein 5-like [Antedon mediterranea]|uniref:FERM domain-containing protein 5-like n=1 Tax=Antedon mediterranea TaxID=105859 RepID=UPI003AF61B66